MLFEIKWSIHKKPFISALERARAILSVISDHLALYKHGHISVSVIYGTTVIYATSVIYETSAIYATSIIYMQMHTYQKCIQNRSSTHRGREKQLFVF